MTEKESIKQGAFWDVSKNTGAEPEVTETQPVDDTTNEFQPHEIRERTAGVHFFDVIFSFFMAAFVSLFLFSMVEDTWHIAPWECPEQVVEKDDGTFQCQHSDGIIESREYDSSGFETIEPTEKVIGVAMYFLIVFLFVVYCWATLSKKDHLQHLGQTNAIVLMTSRFGKTPKIKETIHLQDDSFIQRTSGQYTDTDGNSNNYTTYKIHSKGQKPFNLSKFEEADYAYVTGLEIRR
jgi:hypothetical protein